MSLLISPIVGDAAEEARKCIEDTFEDVKFELGAEELPIATCIVDDAENVVLRTTTGLFFPLVDQSRRQQWLCRAMLKAHQSGNFNPQKLAMNEKTTVEELILQFPRDMRKELWGKAIEAQLKIPTSMNEKIMTQPCPRVSGYAMSKSLNRTAAAFLRAIQLGSPVVLIGGDACGKSEFVRQIAQLVGARLEEFCLTPETEPVNE